MKIRPNRRTRRAALKPMRKAAPAAASSSRNGMVDPAQLGGIRTAFSRDIRSAFTGLRTSLAEQVRQMLDRVQATDYLSLNYDGHWITLESEQHVFIGGDGKLYFHGPPEGRNGKGATGEKGIASKDFNKGQNDGAGSGADVQRGGGSGSGAVDDASASASGPMAGTAQGSAGQGAGAGGHAADQSASGGSARRVAADLGHVNAKLDRFEKLFRSKGQHMVADWMGKLREHINATGSDEALKSLGPARVSQDGSSPNSKQEVQYWGVGTEEQNWKSMGDFIQAYLGRNGISVVTGDTSSPDSPLISALGKPDRHIAEQGDFKPAEMHFKDKLSEAKTLPGLEKSEDISKVIGEPVTHLTDDVASKLDAEYGKGQWIVKCYDDNAAAGYGIFFPQRVQAIGQQARDTIWDAGSKLSQYGFSLSRDAAGKVDGLKHTGGDEYKFGNKKYEDTINGDARHWADQARMAAENEKGPMLPEGSFMVQPAFKAVGISDADRAAGKTWHEKNEGRVHLQTKPDGSVSVIPHSTWLKGGNLPVVFEDDDTRAMADAAKHTVEAIPHEARKGQVYAPDVMKNADGGYSVVELNAQGDFNGSGYLHDNGFTIDAYTSHLTGREPLHVSFIRKLLTARAKGNTATANALLDLLWNQYTVNAQPAQRAKDGRFGHQEGQHDQAPAKAPAPHSGTAMDPAHPPALPPGEQPKTEKELLAKGDKAADSTISKFGQALKSLGNNAAGAWVKSALGWVKDKTVQFYKMLEGRYGKKQAIAIFASGQVFSWSATGIGAMMGIPLVVPGMSVVASIPAMAMAEVYRQVRGKKTDDATAMDDKKPTTNAKKYGPDDEIEVSDEDPEVGQDVGKNDSEEGDVDLPGARKVAAALGRAILKALGALAETTPFPQGDNEMVDPEEHGDPTKVMPAPHDGVTLPTMNEDYQFETSAGKLGRFRAWLRQRMGTTLIGDALIQDYISRAYIKGATRSFAELRKGQRATGQQPIARVPGVGTLPADPYAEAEGYVRSGMQREANVQKVKLLAGRTFSEMEDVTARMGTRMSRILADGLVAGDTPKVIAKRMSDEVGLGMERALLVVRTELVRAHAEGQLDTLDDLGHKDVTAMVEMIGSSDGRMCQECEELKGGVFSLNDARGLIPVHPNCRCAWVPVFRHGQRRPLGVARAKAGVKGGNAPAEPSDAVSNALKLDVGGSLAVRLGFDSDDMTINIVEYDEHKHTRAKDGRFGSQSGNHPGKAAAPAPKMSAAAAEVAIAKRKQGAATAKPQAKEKVAKPAKPVKHSKDEGISKIKDAIKGNDHAAIASVMKNMSMADARAAVAALGIDVKDRSIAGLADKAAKAALEKTSAGTPKEKPAEKAKPEPKKAEPKVKDRPKKEPPPNMEKENPPAEPAKDKFSALHEKIVQPPAMATGKVRVSDPSHKGAAASAKFSMIMEDGMNKAPKSKMEDMTHSYSESLGIVMSRFSQTAKERVVKNLTNGIHIETQTKKAVAGMIADLSMASRMDDAETDRTIASMKSGFSPDRKARLEKDPIAMRDEMRKEWAETSAWAEANKNLIGGAYNCVTQNIRMSGGRTNSTHAGPADLNMSENPDQGLFAHELSHAIDGPGYEYSGSPQWQKIFNTEISPNDPATGQPKLTGYASTVAHEGFAEFARLAYTDHVPQERIESQFPEAVKFFKENGIWPTHRS